jgi:hypothetical protein
MNNISNQFIRTQNYSSTTVLIIVGFICFVGLCIYLYNVYKTFKAKLLATNVHKTISTCPDYWDSIGNNKCQNTKAIGRCSTTEGSNIMDFGGEIFTNANTGNYAKHMWSQSCDSPWSGTDKFSI